MDLEFSRSDGERENGRVTIENPLSFLYTRHSHRFYLRMFEDALRTLNSLALLLDLYHTTHGRERDRDAKDEGKKKTLRPRVVISHKGD